MNEIPMNREELSAEEEATLRALLARNNVIAFQYINRKLNTGGYCITIGRMI